MGDFTPSHAGIGEMLCAPFMVADMKARAERGKEFAEATAPVDEREDAPHPGRYKASFAATSGVRQHKTRRAFGRLTNDAPEAAFVEYGSEHNEAHHTLRKALEVMGE